MFLTQSDFSVQRDTVTQYAVRRIAAANVALGDVVSSLAPTTPMYLPSYMS
jgi:hypothetical protein